MEKQILVEPLQKRFTIGVKDANKQKRNRSFPNASDCCGAKLKQEKFCSVCNEKVSAYNCTKKIVKIGKEEHIIDANVLKQAKDALEEMEEITLHTFLKRRPAEAEEMFESLVYGVAGEKRDAEYNELREILKGRVAIGKGVFRSNEFQLLVEVGDDNLIHLRKLVEKDQMYDKPEAPVETLINPQVLELENTILDKATIDSFDLKEFKDTRAEVEERIIEDVVLNGIVPEVKKEAVQKNELSEIERLKALVGE